MSKAIAIESFGQNQYLLTDYSVLAMRLSQQLHHHCPNVLLCRAVTEMIVNAVRHYLFKNPFAKEH